MLCGRIRMAHHDIAAVCARCLSLVPFVAVAVPAFGFDAADRCLDNQHHPDLLRLALAYTWPAMGASWLGYVARIWFRRNRRRNRRASTIQKAAGGAVLHRLRCMLRMRPEALA